MNYYVSGSYYDKDGILKYGPDSNQRYNLRAKFSAQVNKYIDLGVQASYDGKFIETNPYGTRNILERLYRIRSRQPIYAPEEDPNENPYNGDLQVNPIDIMENGGLNKNQYHSIMGRGNVRIKNLVKGLSFDRPRAASTASTTSASSGISCCGTAGTAPSASTPTTRTPSPGR